MLIPVPSRILVSTTAVDLRKSIDGLAALVEVTLGERPLSGAMFVFTNRRKTGIKLLVWSHGGFTLLYKKLERGRFVLPQVEGDRAAVTTAELAALLEGIDLSGARRLSRWNPPDRPCVE